MGLNTASLRLKIAVVLSLLAAVFHTIGYATYSWRVNKVIPSITQGLWGACDAISCREAWNPSDTFLAVRAMETIGLIMVGAVLVVGVLFLFMDSLRRRTIRSFLILGAIFGVVAITIGLIIYGVVYVKDTGFKVGYSMALTIVGGILELAAAIAYAMDRPR